MRLLEQPHLARLVPQLAPETLHRLVRHAGLDASEAIVAAASPAQLQAMLDLDLWAPTRPGATEQFDADRFGEWLEWFAGADRAVGLRALAAMGERLISAGLSRFIRVFDPAVLASAAAGADEGDSWDPSDAVECEVGGYVIRARSGDRWEGVVALLVALEADDAELFHAVMGGCRRLSNSAPEVDGLDALLTEPDQAMHDLALDRDERRTAQGYLTPADARAFLGLARRARDARPGANANPVFAAYRRDADTRAADADEPSPDSRREDRAALDALVVHVSGDPLEAAGPRALLEGTAPQASRLSRVMTLLATARDADETAYAERQRELAFLANALVAGCPLQSRAMTPAEASDVAVATCNLGLEHWPTDVPADFLLAHGLVEAFEAGWAVLYEQVALFVTDRLVDVLSGLRGDEPHLRDGFDDLRRQLLHARRAGTPWVARDALEALALLDVVAWNSLLALIDECPVLPASLTAVLDGRTRAVSATAFECIATRAQLDAVRTFMRRLPGLLQG